MTVIVEHDPLSIDLLQSALGGGCAVMGALDELKTHLQQHPDEYAVVLGEAVDLAQACAFAERMRIDRPTLGVILLRSRIDNNVLSGAMRAGMREVVESRDLAALSEGVRRVYAVSEAMNLSAGGPSGEATKTPGCLITVFSTKGGVGKSTVATNLAASLAGRDCRVCLVDLDVHSSDVAIMLRLKPTRSLTDLSGMAATLDATGVESLLTEHSEGLYVLAAPVQIETSAQISAEAVGRVLAVLKSSFDVVVVDTSGSFDDFALHAFDASDMLVLVGTLDIPALKSLKLATGTLDLLNFPRERWRLVLNRADSKVGLSVDEFEEILGLTSNATLPSSREVLAAVNRGETIVRAQPKHPISQTLSAFATTLVADATRGPALPEVPHARSADANRAAKRRRGFRKASS